VCHHRRGAAGLARDFIKPGQAADAVADRDAPGGYIRNIELIEITRDLLEASPGRKLATEVVSQATNYGLQFETREVTGLEIFSGTRYVGCSRGQGYTTMSSLLREGRRTRSWASPAKRNCLGKRLRVRVMRRRALRGKVWRCGGGGDAGVTEALYMAKIASKVIIIEAMPALTARRSFRIESRPSRG